VWHRARRGVEVGRRLDRGERVVAARADQLAWAEVGRAARDDQRALTAVDLETVAARVGRYGRAEERDLRAAALEPAGDGDPVGRVDLHRLAALGVAPLGHLGGEPRAHLLEFAQHEAERVDGVAARDRQCVGAVAAVALPDTTVAALVDRLPDHAHARA